MKPISRAAQNGLPEYELLICCARSCLEPEMAGRIVALVRQGINWDRLIRAANHHGLLPLLHSHLSATCPLDVPAPVFDQLREHSQSNSRYNLLLTGELIKLQTLFQSHNIPMVPFKGPILAACFYGDIGLRQFGDLDLLVRKQDVIKARELLASARYLPRYNLAATQQAILIEQKCEEPFDRDDNESMVDLHWAVIPARFSFAPDTDSMWERLEKASLNGVEFLTVSPEDLLILLCVHGAKHAWERLNWICDLAELIRARSSLDWEFVMNIASRNHGERMLFLGLLLAKDLLGAPLPAEVLQRVRDDSPVKRLAAKVYSNLFRSIGKQISVPERDLFYLQAMTRISDRARLCLDHIRPTPLEWQMFALPRPLSFLYYLLRPVRVVGKYGAKLLKLFNDKAVHRRGAEDKRQ